MREYVGESKSFLKFKFSPNFFLQRSVYIVYAYIYMYTHIYTIFIHIYAYVYYKYYKMEMFDLTMGSAGA